jgi:aryl-alcohol dehydrogenase-like predicted oxidoreductase
MLTKSIPLRKLGKDGPSIPAMGFGLMTIAGAHGDRPSTEEQFKILDCALELGDTFWDTSEYGSPHDALNGKPLTLRSIYGDNLEVLAQWFQRTGKRDEIFLASKFGLIMGENLQLKGIDSSGEYCKKACDESLLYSHNLEPSKGSNDFC